MNSIRRSTSAAVAVSMACLLLVGGGALLVLIRREMVAQFDTGLAARAAALQAITRFDGTVVELDVAGDPSTVSSSVTIPGCFALWVREGDTWRVVERSGAPASWLEGRASQELPGIHPCTLPDGSAGRALVVDFVPAVEPDEEHAGSTEREGATAPSARLLVADTRVELDRTLSAVGLGVAAVVACMVVASVIISRWAVARGLRPLTDLSRRVQAATPASPDHEFEPVGQPDELRPITQQLGGLMGRVRETIERERRFSNAVSHELRTPIAELRMLLEVTAARPRSPDEWAATAYKGLGVLDRAQALCESLLHLARASSGAPARKGLTPDVASVLWDQATLAAARHAASTSQIRVVAGPALQAALRPETLAAIVANLLGNALQHGDGGPRGTVDLRAGETRGQVWIEVENLAAGLSGDDLAKLFEPFWRKDDTIVHGVGFGLGLAVSRSLAQSHGGELTASQPSPGVLRMRLEVPSAPAVVTGA